MKLNNVIILLIVIFMVTGGWIWFKSPVGMMEVNPEDIMEILVLKEVRHDWI